MTRRAWIVLLAGVNVALLAAIVLTVYTPPSALAQAVAARRGEYLLVSGRAEVSNDALFLVDAGGRKLHIFRTAIRQSNVEPAVMVYTGGRDLAQDFKGGMPVARPAVGQAEPNPAVQLAPGPQNQSGAQPNPAGAMPGAVPVAPKKNQGGYR